MLRRSPLDAGNIFVVVVGANVVALVVDVVEADFVVVPIANFGIIVLLLLLLFLLELILLIAELQKKIRNF